MRFLYILCLAALPVMTTALLAPALPGMQESFKGEGDADLLVKLVLTAPTLTIALSAGFIGFLVDAWGRRPLLLVGLLTYGLAGIWGAFTDDIYELILSRIVFGFGSAALMVGSAAWLAASFSKNEISRRVSLQAAVMGMWGITAQLIAGALAEDTWHRVFWLYGVSFLMIPGLFWSEFKDNPQAEAIKDQDHNLVGIALWPLLGLGFLSALAMSFFALIAVHCPLLLEAKLGMKPPSIAWLTSGMTAASSLASLSLVFFKPPRLRVLAWGFAAMAFGFQFFLWPASVGLMVAAVIAVGFGIGSIVPTVSALIAAAAPPGVRGRSLGLLLTSNYLGQFVTPFWSHSLFKLGGDRCLFLFCVISCSLLYLIMTWKRSSSLASALKPR